MIVSILVVSAGPVAAPLLTGSWPHRNRVLARGAETWQRSHVGQCQRTAPSEGGRMQAMAGAPPTAAHPPIGSRPGWGLRANPGLPRDPSKPPVPFASDLPQRPGSSRFLGLASAIRAEVARGKIRGAPCGSLHECYETDRIPATRPASPGSRGEQFRLGFRWERSQSRSHARVRRSELTHDAVRDRLSSGSYPAADPAANCIAVRAGRLLTRRQG